MSANQKQITSSFSQNKKQKTNDDCDENSASASADILSNILNEIQGEMELCTDMSSLEPRKTSTSAPSTSPSSTSALLTSPSLTSPLSTPALLTSPSSSASSTSKLKCEATFCTPDHSFVPQHQSDLESSSDKRGCQLGWFLKYQWLCYCKVRN